MQESLTLFQSITELDDFRTVSIVLLFNKFDLLEQQMRENPIVDHYPEYSGDSDPLAAYRFFAVMFSELDCRSQGNLRTLVTSAVELDNSKSTIDKLRPFLFSQVLTWIPEAAE